MISNAIYIPIMNEVSKMQNKHEAWFTHEISGRIANALVLPLGPICSLGDGIVGASASVISLFPCFGLNQSINNFAQTHMFSFGQILGRTFVNTFSVINPRVGATIYNPSVHYPKYKNINGIFTRAIAFKALNLSSTVALSQNIFVRHVFSRMSFAGSACLFAISRTADLALGLVAGAFAVVALGSNKTLNTTAFQGLNFLCVIPDVIDCARCVIYPFNP